MAMAIERPASTSSYFARPPPPSRLLLRVYAAEGLRHVSNHGVYCKLYVGSTEMVRGSGAFARRTQKLSTSGPSHSLGGLLHSPFGSSRGHTPQTPVATEPPTSSSEGDLSGSGSARIRVLKTQVQKGKRPNPVWNEKFDIPILDPSADVLSIRVKSARLMSSPAIGACSIPLKHLGGGSVDRWVDLRLGKKDAGRLRVQLRIVDPADAEASTSASPSARPSQTVHNDSSIMASEDASLTASARTRMLQSSHRGHKYHRSARRFDGTLLVADRSGTKRSPRDDKTSTTPRANSGSATSNDSLDDSEPTSDGSASLVVSPLPSSEDAAAYERSSDPAEASAGGRAPRASFSSLVQASEASTPSPPVAAVAIGLPLDASYAHRGTMTVTELERSRMQLAEITRASNPQVPVEAEAAEGDDDEPIRKTAEAREQSQTLPDKRWTGYSVQSSTMTSSLDPRESSRVQFDDEEEEADDRKQPQTHWASSRALADTQLSNLDPRESSRVQLDLSDSDDDEQDDGEREQQREQQRERQRRQWQLQQRQMLLKEEDDEDSSDSESEDDDEFGGMESPRMPFTPTLAKVLSRQSMNVLMDEEEEEEEDDDLAAFKMSDEFVPILEFNSPASLESVDCALRQPSFS
ncbi:hypothetical protein BBJ28_00010464 [Nothophytophthora sp. Chile5]|nr:hypothetical protein BBJ28_00010464 [Nothophytophthora sp. Chile5]